LGLVGQAQITGKKEKQKKQKSSENEGGDFSWNLK
jgi:hypothetical protein